MRKQWTMEESHAWYDAQPLQFGANYIPAYASNQIEMWETKWDHERIDYELGEAEAIGMNTMRVFLHIQVWERNSAQLKARIEEFLQIADKHHIKPMIVPFDSCWDPKPKEGEQEEPHPGRHNSRWAQSPPCAYLGNNDKEKVMKAYVQDIIGSFKDDPRIHSWDLWNEPCNDNLGSYNDLKDYPQKIEHVTRLLPQVFKWAREVAPTQPLTSGVWGGGAWNKDENLSPIQRTQLTESDIITFHNYSGPVHNDWPHEGFRSRIEQLRHYKRPILCTEYMARENGSTFQDCLPVAADNEVGTYCWGLFAGKSQTNFHWRTWGEDISMGAKSPDGTVPQPDRWFHDVFDKHGVPHDATEIETIQAVTAANKQPLGERRCEVPVNHISAGMIFNEPMQVPASNSLGG